jgi:hypothetical protein
VKNLTLWLMRRYEEQHAPYEWFWVKWKLILYQRFLKVWHFFPLFTLLFRRRILNYLNPRQSRWKLFHPSRLIFLSWRLTSCFTTTLSVLVCLSLMSCVLNDKIFFYLPWTCNAVACSFFSIQTICVCSIILSLGPIVPS